MALVSNHCQKHLKDTLKVSLINDDEYIGPAFSEILTHLEALRKYIWQMEIGQIWDIPTTKLFWWPLIQKSALPYWSKVSKFFLVSSSSLSVYGAWDVPLSSSHWYKLSEEWTLCLVWREMAIMLSEQELWSPLLKHLFWLQCQERICL